MIRPATPADARAIAEVHTRSWWRAYQDVISHEVLTEQTVDDREARWAEWLSTEGRRAVVYELDGRIAGFAGIGPGRDADAPPHVGELATLYVDPPAQGAGVGSQLLASAEELLRRAGFAEAWLWVFRDNGHARAFYERHGWALVEGSEALAPADWREAAVRYRRRL